MASTHDSADIDDSLQSGNPLIDGLLTKYHWSSFARSNFQFTMPDSETDYEDTRDFLIDDYPDDNHIGVMAMPVFMKIAIRDGIKEYNRILPFLITEQGDNDIDTQLRYGLASFAFEGDPNRPAYAYTPQDDGLLSGQANWMSGDTFWNVNRFAIQDSPGGEMVGTYQYHTILHETGHALGLKHGHEEDHGNAALPAVWDSMEFTVMTYRSYVNDPLVDANGDPRGYVAAVGHYAQTLMMLDIQALQYLYGADFSTRSDNTLYKWTRAGRYTVNGVDQWTTDTGVIFLTIWDGGGTDTYDFSDFVEDEDIDLAPGGWSNLGSNLASLGDGNTARGNVFNALQYQGSLASLIENAIGGKGNDTISGNQLANALEGREGNDILYGLEGNDTLTGGPGGDLINGGPGFDTAVYNATLGERITITPLGGNPTLGLWSITGAAQGAGDTLTQIEAFRFGNGPDTILTSGVTAAYSLHFDGRGGNDVINGGDGFDVLIGGLGSDSLRPGLGTFSIYGGSQGGTPGSWVESLAQNDELIVDRTTDPDGYVFNFVVSAAIPLGEFTGDDGS